MDSSKDFNLSSIASRFTSKKDVVVGFDLGYLMVWSMLFALILDVNMSAFFLCGVVWLLLPSNMMTPSQFQSFLNAYPFLTKIFYFRAPPSPISKAKEGD